MELSNDAGARTTTSKTRLPAHGLSAEQIKARMFQVNVERILSAVRPLLTSERYELVVDFFVNHVFMPRDRAGRDRALEEVSEKMKSVNIMDLSKNLQESVELTRLANALDDSLVEILHLRNYASIDEIGPDEIDSAIAEENRYADRRRQVELLGANIRFFHKLSNTALARFARPSMKMFAKATGVACLVDQIDAGYYAAKAISDVNAFVDAILNQECGRLAELFEARASN
jgi:hypothetical protein